MRVAGNDSEHPSEEETSARERFVCSFVREFTVREILFSLFRNTERSRFRASRRVSFSSFASITDHASFSDHASLTFRLASLEFHFRVPGSRLNFTNRRLARTTPPTEKEPDLKFL